MCSISVIDEHVVLQLNCKEELYLCNSRILCVGMKFRDQWCNFHRYHGFNFHNTNEWCRISIIENLNCKEQQYLLVGIIVAENMLKLIWLWCEQRSLKYASRLEYKALKLPWKEKIENDEKTVQENKRLKDKEIKIPTSSIIAILVKFIFKGYVLVCIFTYIWKLKLCMPVWQTVEASCHDIDCPKSSNNFDCLFFKFHYFIIVKLQLKSYFSFEILFIRSKIKRRRDEEDCNTHASSLFIVSPHDTL
jgi:hypothetical protein